MELSTCQLQPWVCQSTATIFFQRYWVSVLILVFFSIVATATLLFILNVGYFLGLQKKLRKKSLLFNKPLATQVGVALTSFLFFLLSPLIIVQAHYGQFGIVLTDEFLHCVIVNAPNECYVEAAKTAVHGDTPATISYENGLNICNIALYPEKCKLSVCQSLRVYGSNESVEALAVQARCRESVSTLCPDGNILDHIPCSCYLPEEDRVAVYTNYWYEEYWNKYRKMDRAPYCCEGVRSSYLCGD